MIIQEKKLLLELQVVLYQDIANYYLLVLTVVNIQQYSGVVVYY